MINFKFNKTKKNITLLIVLCVSILMIAVSFAYFLSQAATPAITDVFIGSEDGERLMFTPGDPINLVVTTDNLAKEDGSLTVSTTASASFYASESLGSATTTYNAYYTVMSNTFDYTQNSTIPEIILIVTDPSGNEVTSIDGLVRKTVVDADNVSITGFDITSFEGRVILAEDKEISNNNFEIATVDEWTIEVRFVNLTTNQIDNMGKSLESELILQKEKVIGLTDYLVSNHVASNGFIQHTSSLTNSAGDDNYRYSGGDDVVTNNYLCFGSNEAVCPIENMYRIIGIFDGNIKIIKELPIDKNKDGTYDIIHNGVDTFAFHGTSNSDASNKWEGNSTSVNTDDADINKYLNTTYYAEFDSSYQNMIEEKQLYIGNYTMGYNVKEMYTNSVSVLSINKYKLGLMNSSDYMYAANSNYWGLENYEGSEPHTDSYHKNTEMQNDNWLYIKNNGLYLEWLLNPVINNTVSISQMYYDSNVTNSPSYSMYAIRPTMYLKSDVNLIDGDGSRANPFRIGL